MDRYTSEYRAENRIKNLKWELKKRGVNTKEQAEILECTPQNVNRHYRESSFSAKQYLMLQDRLDEAMRDDDL